MNLTKQQVDDLINKGYALIPQLVFDITSLNEENLAKKTYNENSKVSQQFLSSFNLNELKDQLAKLAKDKLNISADKNDIYSITRFLQSYDNLESYRGHFDSHIFTIVTPVKIPNTNSRESGQLIVFPKIRKNPTNEFINFYEKLKYKLLYGSKKGYQKLMEKNHFVEFDFKDKCSIIFLGRQCFHGNRSFAKAPDGERITILTHFFDPNKKGIGSLLRKIRNR
tara:strand:+ start:294 stop:965 length:672 start_codon:yes stop_codon:yes gene_type:complete